MQPSSTKEQQRQAMMILREKEVAFISEFTSRGFLHVKIAGDGNCFYRAFRKKSLTLVQGLYGNQNNFMRLKQYVSDYMLTEIKFFGQFISHSKGPKHYANEVRKDGVWADNLEIQIVSEIYDCRIEIYTTSRTPIKVFNEKPEAIKTPIRLLYLQQSHYELIFNPMTKPSLETQSFGLIEEASLEAAKSRDHNQIGASSMVQGEGSPSQDSRMYFEKLSKLE